jgi:hypothetical protein
VAQNSIFWTTGTSGDGTSAYTQAQLFSWLKRSFLGDASTEGVLKGYAGALAVSGTSSPISVAAGAAVVNGIPYESDSAVSVTVPTPLIGTTGHRVVLRADYAAKTVRIALLSSSDGVASPPAVTQADGTTWEVSLATLTITTGGVITVTDTRSYAHFRTGVNTAMLDDQAVTSTKLGAGAVTEFAIAGGSVTATKIGSGAVTQAKLGSDTLQRIHIPLGFGESITLATSYTEAVLTGNGRAAYRVTLNKDQLPAGATVKLRVLLYSTANNGRLYARLWNVTDGAAVTGSTIDTGVIAGNTDNYATSGDLAAGLASGEKTYTVQVHRDAGQLGNAMLLKAELIVEW